MEKSALPTDGKDKGITKGTTKGITKGIRCTLVAKRTPNKGGFIMSELMSEEINVIEDMETATDFELKHTPCVEVSDVEAGRLVKVSIGLNGIEHPQTEEHLIDAICVLVDGDMVAELAFTADDEPVAECEVAAEGEIVVRASCNLHGIWQATA
ncbi:MAG: hypothetical protein LBB42_03200 [Coriobacteriales bacterium]|nr:hypothetical protein [Coriobacteriales bacterium]